MKNNIGTILYTDMLGYNKVIHCWETRLIPIIEKTISSYKALGIGPFSEEVYKDIHSNGIANIKQRYVEAVTADMKGLGTKTLAASRIQPGIIQEDLSELQKLSDQIRQVIQSVNSATLTTAEIKETDCKIIQGRPVIQKEEIIKRFQVVIEDDLENEFYNLLLELQASHNKVRKFVEKNKRSSMLPSIFSDSDYHGFVYENDGSLEISMKCFKSL